jgi:hypothetical protein
LVTWLSNLSILLALPLFAAVFAAAAVLAHSILRPLLPPPERLSQHHEVAGFLMGVVGVLYSVVLGFLVGTVWTAFAAAQQTADLEAGYVADAFNFAGQLPPPQRIQLQRVLAGYAIEVRKANWSAARGQAVDPAAVFLNSAVRITVTVPPPPRNANAAQIRESSAIRDSLLDSLRSIADTRRLRLIQAASHMPAGMLEALVLGAMIVIAFTFFFGVRSYAKQMAMTALLAGSIGLFFGLIVELSTPYSGSIQVSRHAWDVIIDTNRMQELSR